MSRKNAERARAFGDRRGLVDLDDEGEKRSLKEKEGSDNGVLERLRSRRGDGGRRKGGKREEERSSKRDHLLAFPSLFPSTTPSILSQFEMSEYQWVPFPLFYISPSFLTLVFLSLADLFDPRRTTPFCLLLPRSRPTPSDLLLLSDQRDGEG